MDARPSGESRARSRRPAVLAVAALGVVALVAMCTWLVALHRSGPVAAPPPETVPPTTVTTTVPKPASPVPATTTIAEVTGPVAYASEPGGEQVGTLPMGSWWQATKFLPVIEVRDRWLHVRLPQRPNGSTGWIAASDATLSSTTYGILIDTSSRRVQLYEAGRVVADMPAGVGTDDDPTPLGQFYVMDVADPPGPGWGPFVIDTNAHSEAITSWEGKGDAFTAIHGPLGADTAIGTDGAAISHGCVRLHHDDLALLAAVPAGAPVVIVS